MLRYISVLVTISLALAAGDARAQAGSGLVASSTSVAAFTVVGDPRCESDVHLSSGDGETLSWSASADQPWISFATPIGTTSGTLAILMDASQLSTGLHTANVTVSTSGSASSLVIPVSITVDPLTGTILKSDTSSDFDYAISESAASGTDRAFLLEIDTAAKGINRVIPVGTDVTDIAIHPADNAIYVTNWYPGLLLAIDKTTFALRRTYNFSPAVGSEQGLDAHSVTAFGPGRVIVEGGDGDCAVQLYDTVHGATLTSFFTATGGGAADPTGRYYYHGEAGNNGGTIAKYDLSTGKFIKVAAAGGTGFTANTGRVVISEDGTRVFWDGGMFDPNLNLLWSINTIKFINPDIIATSPDGRFAFATDEVFDTIAQRLTAFMPWSATLTRWNSTSNDLVTFGYDGIHYTDCSAGSFLEGPVASATVASGSDVSISWKITSPAITFSIQELSGTGWQPVGFPAGLAVGELISGLTPGTTYQFRVSADSPTLNSEYSNVMIVTPQAPTVITGSAIEITATSAVLTGTAYSNGTDSTAWFEYGRTTSYGFTTGTFAVGEASALQAGVTGLPPGTSHHFRLVTRTGAFLSSGADQTWSNFVIPPGITGVNASLSIGTLTLSGIVNPNNQGTSAAFEFGVFPGPLNTTLPVQSSLTGTTGIPVQVTVPYPNAPCQFRIVATNGGGTQFSPIYTIAPGAYGSIIVTTDSEVLSGTSGVTPSQLMANPDLAFASRGAPCVINVLANDFGDPAALHIVAVGKARRGKVAITSRSDVTYTPGSRFSGKDSFTYTVADGFGNTSTATVTVDYPDLAVAGCYNTLVGTGATSFADSGLLTVTVAASGEATGRLLLGDHAGSFHASILSGTVSVALKVDSHPVSIGLALDPAFDSLSGVISTANWSQAFVANRVPFTTASPPPGAGRFTAILSDTTTVPLPQGYGFATLVMGRDGLIRANGRAPSGAVFSTSSYFDPAGSFPFYAVIKGSHPANIHGVAQFQSIASRSGFSGIAGYSLSTAGTAAGAEPYDLQGATYDPPSKIRSVHDSIASPISISLGRRGTTYAEVNALLGIRELASHSPLLSDLTLNDTTGAFSGNVTLPGFSAHFSGVVFADEVSGAGTLISPVGTGWVLIQAIDEGGGGVIIITGGGNSPPQP